MTNLDIEQQQDEYEEKCINEAWKYSSAAKDLEVEMEVESDED